MVNAEFVRSFIARFAINIGCVVTQLLWSILDFELRTLNPQAWPAIQ